ncbi:uncharacterized protein LOC131309523 [Rhododendron vialii]|uniref:uncharacterized protein LOC131309523 n=1 Tax=Rhododendron vialii TaxID=182163 RepID=UPI00265E3ACF|nr:uncharacterized protein LOC131309523 [Rhododendron vialii]
MRCELFMRNLEAIEGHNPYFVQKVDACQVSGPSSIQKMTSSMRMLAYGMPANANGDYLRLRQCTTIECFEHFCRAIIEIYGDVYLRSSTVDDVSRLLAIGEACGFPPLASYDLWIWHAFFGMPGSHNDCNVLDCSLLFDELVQGRAPPANYSINGHTTTWVTIWLMAYILNGRQLFKLFHLPNGKKITLFENARVGEKECGVGIWGSSSLICNCAKTNKVLGS